MSEPGPLSAEADGYTPKEMAAALRRQSDQGYGGYGGCPHNLGLFEEAADRVEAFEAALLAEQQTNERAGHLIRGLLDWIGVAFEDMQEPERLKCLEAPSVVVSAAGFLAALAESPRATGQETT